LTETREMESRCSQTVGKERKKKERERERERERVKKDTQLYRDRDRGKNENVKDSMKGMLQTKRD